MTDKKFKILDWVIISVAFTAGLFVIYLVKNLLGYFDDDGGSRGFIVITSFIIGLTQIGLLVSPWAVKSENVKFKTLTAVSMLPASIMLFFLLTDVAKSIFNFGFLSSYSRNSIFAAPVILFVLILYGIQFLRLLSIGGKQVKLFDS